MKHKIFNIHPNAILGKDVIIENFVTIEEDVIIGDGTWVGPHVSILSGSRIGKNCQIFPGSVIGAIAQYKNKALPQTYVEIGDHTIVREYVTLNRGTLGHTIIGSHVLLMAYVHVAHDCVIEDHVVVSNATQLSGHVKLQHNAVIGGMTAIHQFICIGAYSMVASKSIVRKNVPPFIKVAREPLRYCGINIVALQRNSFTKYQCNIIENSYRLIYRNKMLVILALEAIEQDIPNTVEKDMILSFIRNSSKGIVKKNNYK